MPSDDAPGLTVDVTGVTVWDTAGITLLADIEAASPGATFTGLTPAQRYAVLKVMNEKPCDCGCPHGTTAKCLKDDPNCPRAPVILSKAIEMAKAGSTAEQITAAVKKTDDAPGAKPPAGAAQKVDVAAWSPILGPKYAKVTIIEYSDFQ